MIIDTHCHIDLYPNPKQVLKDLVKNDTTVLAMTNLPSHFEMGYMHFQSLKRIRLALGMHPLMADSHEKEFNKFLKNINKTSYIGEVGLDFSNEGISTKEIQINTFTKILKAISGQKKILSIHSRKAEKEVLELLIKNSIKSAIFHWYSGGINMIEDIVDTKYFFSINPAMTRSASGRKIISNIPRELVLTETDGPFINHGSLPIRPGEVKEVISFLTNEWHLEETEIQKIIFNNFKRLLNQLKT